MLNGDIVEKHSIILRQKIISMAKYGDLEKISDVNTCLFFMKCCPKKCTTPASVTFVFVIFHVQIPMWEFDESNNFCLKHFYKKLQIKSDGGGVLDFLVHSVWQITSQFSKLLYKRKSIFYYILYSLLYLHSELNRNWLGIHHSF